MFSDLPNLDLVLRAFLLGPLALLWIALVVRIVGLRSFSKMTAFDFITTVATGSLLAGAAAATEWSAFFQSSAAVGALLGMQAIIAGLRIHFTEWVGVFENEPILLMKDGKMLSANMCKARVSESDIRAKLREANVLKYCDVRAVVLETTGDISVLHGDDLERSLLETVRRN